MVPFNDRFIIEVVASKEDRGIAGGFEPIERFMRWYPGASHEELEQQKEWNDDYITRRTDFLAQDNVFKGHIRDITEPVNVMIDIHEANKETPTDHLLVTAVSQKTEKVVAQLLIPLSAIYFAT